MAYSIIFALATAYAALWPEPVELVLDARNVELSRPSLPGDQAHDLLPLGAGTEHDEITITFDLADIPEDFEVYDVELVLYVMQKPDHAARVDLVAANSPTVTAVSGPSAFRLVDAPGYYVWTSPQMIGDVGDGAIAIPAEVAWTLSTATAREGGILFGGPRNSDPDARPLLTVACRPKGRGRTVLAVVALGFTLVAVLAWFIRRGDAKSGASA